MKKPKIYVHRLGAWYSLYMNEENEKALNSIADVVCEKDRVKPLSTDELKERMQGCSVILSLFGEGANEITADVLESVGSIKLICIAHWCEQLVDTARQAGIKTIEGSNANTIAVAEWTVAAALMGTRKLHSFSRALKNGSPWAEPRRTVGLLCESIVGLIGLGRIGWYVSHYLKAMGVKIIGYDKYYTKERAEELGVTLVSLDELMRTADIISLHLPVTDETKGILGSREFTLIKDDAIFINSARAELYDEEALVTELQKDRFTAYIDVYKTEPLPLDHEFRSMDNVIITPHIAGDNAAMFLRCGREAIQTLKDYFEGRVVRDRRYSYP